MNDEIYKIIRSTDREREQTSRRPKLTKNFWATTILVFVFSNFGCQANQSILNSGKASANSAGSGNAVERPKNNYEIDLGDVQKSGFDYIFVFRRKDGGKFEKDDKIFLRENSPAVTNQFVLTDEDRVVIAGSNYPFPNETLEVLRTLFTIEDLSPKKAEAANGNFNQANANSNQANVNLNRTNAK